MLKKSYNDIVVLIPAYKPDNIMLEYLKQLKDSSFKIVVVNDGSGKDFDNIFAQASQLVPVVGYEKNHGKGYALRYGFEYILQHENDCIGVITADADGQHTLTDVKKLADALLENEYKFILGVRCFSGKIPFRSKFGNTITKGMFFLTSGMKLKDTQTGLRAFTMDIVPDMLKIDGNRYEYEMNVLYWAADLKLKVKQIDIETVYLDEENSSSHFRPIADSVRIYGSIFKFLASSIGSGIIDYLLVLLFKFFSDIFVFGLLTGPLAETVSLAIAVVLARIISSTFNFYINYKVVFKSKDKLSSSFGKYAALAVVLLIASYSILWVLDVLLKIPTWIAKPITDIVLFMCSYFVQRKFVFKSQGR